MEDGTKENPYTREDVLRLIEENGGTAKGLNLSGKIFEEEIDLSKLNLEDIILKETFLKNAHFEGSVLWGSHLEGAYLEFAHFEGAELHFAHLERALLWFAEFSPDTKLDNIDWGSYILWEEMARTYSGAAITYRRLKTWHTNGGMYDVAGEFFFREMTAKRKAMKWWPNPLNRAFAKLISVLCGYGEKPERVVVSALVLIFGLAIAYYLWGSFNTSSFWDTLYYSIVSFTAVGYGNWAPQPTGWAKGVGAAEAFLGVFMMALFLITFVRKMTR